MIFGLYRIPAKDGHPADVRIDNNGIEHSMEERVYRTGGYKPHVADLPSEEIYLARQWQFISLGGSGSTSSPLGDAPEDTAAEPRSAAKRYRRHRPGSWL